MTSGSLQVETDLLNRTGWMKAHGFDADPFPLDSFRGEKDPVLQAAFLTPDDVDFDLIKGKPGETGYIFIFASAGGGKSSIRTQIKSELGPKAVPEDKHVLVVEYVDHSYDKQHSDVLSHVNRLKWLIERALVGQGAGGEYESASAVGVEAQAGLTAMGSPQANVESARGLLLDAFALCRARGFDAVCILVDVDSESDYSKSDFQRVLPLATASSLFDVDGLIFKFLLPLECKSKHGAALSRGNKYPLYEVKWDRERLRRALEDRLVACQMQSEKESLYDPRLDHKSFGVSLLAQLCTQELYGTIKEEFVEFGLDMGCPRAMWQLGYYLLEEHFNLSPNYRRRSRDELIERHALDCAYSRLSMELPSYATSEARQTWVDARQEIEKLIVQGTNDALDKAFELFRSYDKNSAIAMQARLHRALNDYRQGRMSRDDYDVILTQIIGNLLEQLR